MHTSHAALPPVVRCWVKESKRTPSSSTTLPALLQVKVACTQDVLEVMELGQRNRSVAETKMNERSSRSHSVLTVIVDGLNNVTGIRTHGCLHLIDLAGAYVCVPLSV